ncbi:hypothetical protein [Crenobacter caeni]|uniref:Uncharacterized protein n=1 Tax=Crenobacter caeni TaxID=2705474 RepID=A0A6B2KQB4_9NEIS|nr:hypothetical protein [Crenobacter caeni]NDV12283.1 hypothetical protein [Crenobacter caeni]
MQKRVLLATAVSVAVLYAEAALLGGYSNLQGVNLLRAPLEACQGLAFSLAFGLGVPNGLALAISAALMVLPPWLIARLIVRWRG